MFGWSGVEWSGVDRPIYSCMYEKLPGNGLTYLHLQAVLVPVLVGLGSCAKWCFPVYLVARKSVREDLENR